MRNLLSAKKAELENLLLESEAALEQEEERVHQLNTEKANLQLNINNLEEQWVTIANMCHHIAVHIILWYHFSLMGWSVCYVNTLTYHWRCFEVL